MSKENQKNSDEIRLGENFVSADNEYQCKLSTKDKVMDGLLKTACDLMDELSGTSGYSTSEDPIPEARDISVSFHKKRLIHQRLSVVLRKRYFEPVNSENQGWIQPVRLGGWVDFSTVWQSSLFTGLLL